VDARPTSIRQALAVVAEPDTPEERDVAWDFIVRRFAHLEEQFESLRAEMQFVNDAALSFHKGEEGKARALNVIATRSSVALNPASRQDG